MITLFLFAAALVFFLNWQELKSRLASGDQWNERLRIESRDTKRDMSDMNLQLGKLEDENEALKKKLEFAQTIMINTRNRMNKCLLMAKKALGIIENFECGLNLKEDEEPEPTEE